MTDTIPTPAAAPEAAVVASAPAVAPVVEAPAKPTPQELRSGALWNDPVRRDAWLAGDAPTEPVAAPPAEPAATSEDEPPAEDGEHSADASASAPGYRRAGERGPKVEVVDAAGQPVALDLAAVKVRTKAGGEVVELAIPDLVRRVQSAAGAERHVATLQQQLAQTAQTHEQALTQARTAAEQQTAALAQMLVQSLTDDDARAALRAEVADYLSPAQQLERERADRAAERETFARSEAQRQYDTVAQAVLAEVAPVLDALPQQFPHVDAEELAGHFTRLTAQFVGPDGVTIRPQYLPQVHAIVTQELPRLARARHDAIEARIQAAAQSAQQDRQQAHDTLAAATARAQHDAQQATNTLARALRPAGGPGGVATAPAKPANMTLKQAQAWARQSYAGT